MSVLFLLASLGVVNGALTAAYLIFKKLATVADRYFGGLILALSIRIGKSVFFYFELGTDRLLLQIGLSACIFIGPFFFLYAKALVKNDQVFKKSDLTFLGSLLILIVAVGIIYPYRVHIQVWTEMIIQGIYLVWVVFTLLGLKHIATLLKTGAGRSGKRSSNQRYILAVTIAMLFITGTYQFALFIQGFTYIWGAVAFSFTFYYLLVRVLLKNTSVAPKSSNPPLENGQELLRQVNTWMEEKKPFVNQKLKLDQLAADMGLSRHLLSRVLNEEYPFGFSQYMQEYRINEAKELIASRPELSLEGIGYEAGFNSKSAFFQAFKNIVKCTPAEFKKGC